MRKGIITIVTVLCLAIFAGCSEGKDKQGEATREEKQFVSEDYEPGSRNENLKSMMKTDKGFYYYAYADRGLHYSDFATGKTMFLCNKPECRHDGNEFCVATNQKYITLDMCLYNDVILKYAVEKTDTQYRFKVLSVALDGSAMNEIATTLEFEKPTEDFSIYPCFMLVHRNKAFLTMAGVGQAELEEYHGVAILDLNTKKVTYLDEEPFGSSNVVAESVTAAGDYFYYCRKDGKKLLLHRYNIVDGTDESFRLLPNFDGQYVVVDEDTIAYIKRSGTVICTYRISTGQNTEQTRVMRQFYDKWQDGSYRKSEDMRESMVNQLTTDGTYIYAAEPKTDYMKKGENGELVVIRSDAYIHVLNQNLEEVMLVDMAEAVASLGYDDMKWDGMSYTQLLRYMGDDIYWNMVPRRKAVDVNTNEIIQMDIHWKMGTTDSEWYVFRCKRDGFVAGEPKFEFMYRYDD